MKFVVNNFKLGQEVTAQVEELLPDDHLIVNFKGDLMRVSNLSQMIVEVGESVRLKVTAVNPLAFQLLTKPSKKSIDVSI